ncbi:MAG: TetR/AcrR family transcriptional regulator [Deltaproteobacteria bacterium]|nr:TetR/AcrR family transcriptional regulator [Deltaproteobacteria bacterium]
MVVATGRRPGRPRAEVSAHTRDDILRAGRICFAANGYRGTSFQRIASQANISRSALYHWFESKPDLFVQVHADSIRIMMDAYRIQAAEHRHWKDKLRSALEANVGLAEEHPGLWEVVAMAFAEAGRDPELDARIGQQGEEITTLFGSWLEQGVEAGEIDPALDLKNVCGLLESTLFGLAWYRSMIRRPWDWHDVPAARSAPGSGLVRLVSFAIQRQ